MLNRLAEREGFEPSVHLVSVHTISSRAPSAVLGHLSARGVASLAGRLRRIRSSGKCMLQAVSCQVRIAIRYRS